MLLSATTTYKVCCMLQEAKLRMAAELRVALLSPSVRGTAVRFYLDALLFQLKSCSYNRCLDFTSEAHIWIPNKQRVKHLGL